MLRHPHVQEHADDIKAAMAEALPACAPACKGKRLGCLQALVDKLSLPQLQSFAPTLLGEVSALPRARAAVTLPLHCRYTRSRYTQPLRCRYRDLTAPYLEHDLAMTLTSP